MKERNALSTNSKSYYSLTIQISHSTPWIANCSTDRSYDMIMIMIVQVLYKVHVPSLCTGYLTLTFSRTCNPPSGTEQEPCTGYKLRCFIKHISALSHISGNNTKKCGFITDDFTQHARSLIACLSMASSFLWITVHKSDIFSS